MEEKNGRGRPHKDNSKNKRIELRIDMDDRQMLDYVSGQTGQSVSDIIRNGIRIQYDYEKSVDRRK